MPTEDRGTRQWKMWRWLCVRHQLLTASQFDGSFRIRYAAQARVAHTLVRARAHFCVARLGMTWRFMAWRSCIERNVGLCMVWHAVA